MWYGMYFLTNLLSIDILDSRHVSFCIFQDEYLIPPKEFITVVDVIEHMNAERKREGDANKFVLKCKLATTCEEDLGCDDKNRFRTFLERHGCVSDDTPPTNPKKYIVCII